MVVNPSLDVARPKIDKILVSSFPFHENCNRAYVLRMDKTRISNPSEISYIKSSIVHGHIVNVMKCFVPPAVIVSNFSQHGA